MTKDTLSGLNRAAVLLMCLGEEATAKVFQELSDNEIHLITKTMAAINHIPLTVKNAVLQQYYGAQQEITGLFFKGNEFAKNSITATDSGERTESLLNRHISETESKSFASISAMKPHMVADILEKEHPQTIALVLSTQDSDHSAEIISHLPELIQSEIVYRIAKLENVSLEVLSNLEKSLEREIGQTIAEKQKDIAGFDRAVDLLSKMKNNINNAILEKLDDTDRELAGRMRKKMFTFEGLLDLDDRILQLILREVNNDSLALALKTASDELKNKIFANMSSRAAEMIQEDIEALGPVRLPEAEAMQQSIVKTAIRLKEQGSFRDENGNKNVLL